MKLLMLQIQDVSSISKSNAKQSTRQFYTVKRSKGRRREHQLVNDNSLKNCERSFGQCCSLNS